MPGIFDTVQQQLGPDTINQVSQQLGVDSATAQQAVTAALPVVLGGMASHADDPAAAAAIHSEADNHASLLGGLGNLIPGGGGGGGILGGLASAVGAGGLGSVLGSVLGSKNTQVQDGVSKASGLDPQRSKQLMMILVPIVLAAIAHHKRQSNLDPAQMSPSLQNEAREAQDHAVRQQPHLGGILGSIMSHAMQKPRT
ncbi:MAG TPA: DUF937 domain-containing protein [Gemmatimonadaceae bacterium]|nr:DUF937 domain-containing protein [Gemmatimonadaceae bacterium]